MSVAPELAVLEPDPMTLVRAINRMTAAGFSIRVGEGQRLLVSPLSKLTEPQRAFIRSHKAELVALLQDAEGFHRALLEAGSAGLGWREGTPGEWSDDYRLAVVYLTHFQGRSSHVLGRRYAASVAPPMPAFHDAPDVPEIEPVAEETA